MKKLLIVLLLVSASFGTTIGTKAIYVTSIATTNITGSTIALYGVGGIVSANRAILTSANIGTLAVNSIQGNLTVNGVISANQYGIPSGNTTCALSSGTYLPNWTRTSNITLMTNYPAHWVRVGDTVTVTGVFLGRFLAQNARAYWDFSLPIASTVVNGSSVWAVVGLGASHSVGSAVGQPLFISDGANAASNANLDMYNTWAIGNYYFSYTLQYRIK